MYCIFLILRAYIRHRREKNRASQHRSPHLEDELEEVKSDEAQVGPSKHGDRVAASAVAKPQHELRDRAGHVQGQDEDEEEVEGRVVGGHEERLPPRLVRHLFAPTGLGIRMLLCQGLHDLVLLQFTST